MRLLAFAVGVFAVAIFLVGLHRPDTAIFLLAGAALACAATTFLDEQMSIFLKVFNAIFAVETIVFGLAFLVDQLGLWPPDYADYTLPESLPFAVALFGCLTFALSFIPVVRKMTGIADPYFHASAPTTARIWPFPPFVIAQNRLAKVALVFLIVVNQLQVAIEVRLSFYSRDFYNALQNKDLAEFWRQLLYVFLPFASIYVASIVIEYVVTSTFVIRWRRWLSGHYIGRWLSGGAHYNMALAGSPTDNPDQRISEDIYGFIYGSGSGTGIYGYSVTILSTLTSLVSFAIVLWGLSANFTLPGSSLLIPGFLFWVALLYAGLGTAVTHAIGRPLVRLFFAQQRFEADFRFDLARLREYSEQIALLRGEETESLGAMSKFANIYDNYMRIVHVRKTLRVFTEAYNLASQYIPFIVGAPFYFTGKIQLGVLIQVARAFGNVNSSLTFFVSQYVGLADFKAVLDRLTSFDAAIDRALALKAKKPRIEIVRSNSSDLRIEELDLGLPDGSALARVENLSFAARQPTLLVGPSGAGKSTLLRAIAGIWPFGVGRIAEPKASLMLLPQRPYIPLGALRNAIAYPAAPSRFSDAELRDALAACGLPHLVNRLDDAENWQLQLSGGEKQRLAVARALLAAPDWLFLDEATSALDEASEAELYRALARKLPDTTLVSIGHRATLSAFHKRRIEMSPRQDGPARVREAEA